MGNEDLKSLKKKIETLEKQNKKLTYAIESAELKFGIEIKKIYLSEIWISFNNMKIEKISYSVLKENYSSKRIIDSIEESWTGSIYNLICNDKISNVNRFIFFINQLNERQYIIFRIHLMKNLVSLNKKKIIDNFNHIDLSEQIDNAVYNANFGSTAYHPDEYYLHEIKTQIENHKGLDKLYLNLMHDAIEFRTRNSYFLNLLELIKWINLKELSSSSENINVPEYENRFFNLALDNELINSIREDYHSQVNNLIKNLLNGEIVKYIH